LFFLANNFEAIKLEAGDGWLVPGDGFGASPVGMLAGGLNHRDVGVIARNLGAVFSQQVYQIERC